jgi:hypothetical protein
MKKALSMEIFGRQAAAMRLNSGNLAPDLIQMNRCDNIQ